MTATTSPRGYPYPQSSDGYTLHTDIQALAEAINDDVHALDDSTDARLDALEAKAARVYTKANSTSRNTNAVVSNDPDLASIALEAGTYIIELVMLFTVASTTPKIKTQWAFSGSWSTPLRACMGPGNVTTPGGGPEAVQETTLRAYNSNSDATYNATTSGAYSVAREVAANVVVSGSGNLSLQWAQSTSNGSNVSVQAGSYFRITRTA